jgi:uncharacterized LabA/DUF88 family protein
VDRCALFVDAGYVLADGAMAVHGTRRRESVSWDYAGLLQLLTSLATERSGLPLLRCYWYEATVEGRRSADHDALADLPGLKLRVAKMRPGRREGVESEIHRDLTTLARNKAVSDAMLISAEEDLAQVIADVQDLGLRVSLLHIAVDGNWTISRTLRQECDDIVEIGSAHLRPYVELISGAEPPYPHEREGAPSPLIALRPMANGNGQVGRTASYAPPSAGLDDGRGAPPSIYTAPVVAEYQRSAPQLPRPPAGDAAVAREDSQPPGVVQEPPGRPGRPDSEPVRQHVAPAEPDGVDAPAEPVAAAADYPGVAPDLGASPELGASPDFGAVALDQARGRQDPVHDLQNAVPIGQDQPVLPLREHPAAVPQEPQPAGQELYAAPVAVHAPPVDQPAELPAPESRQGADLSGYNPGAVREQLPWNTVTREPLPGELGDGHQPVPVGASPAPIRRLPTRGGQSTPPPGQSSPPQPSPGQPPAAQPSPGQPPGSAATAAQPAIEQPAWAQPPAGQRQHASPVRPTAQGAGSAAGGADYAAAGSGYVSAGSVAGVAAGAGYEAARNGSYTGPRPVAPAGPGPGVPAGPGIPAGPAAAGGAMGLAGQPHGPQSLSVPGGPGGQPRPGPAVPAGSIGPASFSGPLAGSSQGIVAGGPGGPVGPAGTMPYSGGQPAFSLGDAVHSAHQEGQAFGESVARDAPALWLEAVLARKPRMPSDLEARLLQGSTLPIDFLLHDEVRHALRRGFWDALERARR